MFVYPLSQQNLSLEESWSLLTLFEESHRGRITKDLDLEHHGKYRLVLAFHSLESSIFCSEPRLSWSRRVLSHSVLRQQGPICDHSMFFLSDDALDELISRKEDNLDLVAEQVKETEERLVSFLAEKLFLVSRNEILLDWRNKALFWVPDGFSSEG